MLPELKKDLEANVAAAGPSYIDASARRKDGKVLFRNRELHDFSRFDVLGLAQHQKVKRAAQEVIETSGISNCGSRRNAGTSEAHLICEKSLATFFGYERSLLFSSRNQAVFSLLATLLREQDLVYCDADYAGLLSDVCLLVNCPLEVLALDKLQTVEKQIESPVIGRRKFLIADSVSASSGRRLDLLALSAICSRHNVSLVVDESFALGILGTRGAGVSEENDLVHSPTPALCVLSDLGFGLGCYGACVSGPAVLIDSLVARSRTLANEPSFPSPLAMAIGAAVDVCERALAARTLIKAKREFLLAGLNKIKQRLAGIDSSFCSITFGKWKEAKELHEHLVGRGYLTEVLSSPGNFSEAGIVRIIPNSWHSDSLLSEICEAITLFVSQAKLS